MPETILVYWDVARHIVRNITQEFEDARAPDGVEEPLPCFGCDDGDGCGPPRWIMSPWEFLQDHAQHDTEAQLDA